MSTDLAAGLTAGLEVGRSDVEGKVPNLKQNHRRNKNIIEPGEKHNCRRN
jgi:hypothetical protein